MDPEVLPDAEDLWWSWAAVAALHRAAGDPACDLDDERVLRLDGDDGWVRMQRTLGTRAVLWGRSALAVAGSDSSRQAPDWAVSDAVLRRAPSFLAWHAHGEWDVADPVTDEGAVHLLRPLLTVDPHVVRALRRGDLTAPVVRRLLDVPGGPAGLALLAELADGESDATGDGPAYGGAVLTRVWEQVHQQMRLTEDRDRLLMQRPVTLVQWARVHAQGAAFDHAVMVVRDELRPAPGNTRLDDTAELALTNVLRTLHREEAGEDSGAWLFARVWSDGTLLRLERVFDGWPAWWPGHADQGPTLDELAWEMGQRTAAWRPAWSTLLPRA